MKINSNKETVEIEILGETVRVYKKIPTIEKIALIETAIERAATLGTIFPTRIAFEAALGTLIVYRYSDLELTEVDGETEFSGIGIYEEYDLFNNNDIITTIASNIDKEEYKTLMLYADDHFKNALKFYNSGMSLLEEAIKTGILTTKTEATKKEEKEEK